MNSRRWRPPEPVAVPEALTGAVGSPWLAELLVRRGLGEPAAALAWLDGPPGGLAGLDALALPGMDAAVSRLVRAVRTGEVTCVYGDYDSDGVTATALLVRALTQLGARVRWYVPSRLREGYGISAASLQALAAEGVRLLLTCDCGIRNLAEVALAGETGMDVIVSDHHEPGEALPPALAVIDPKLWGADHPCRPLSGAGVAYLLVRRLALALGGDPATADAWLDLAAVGTIADVVPLTGANRPLVRAGLRKLWSEPQPGLAALQAVAGIAPPGGEEDVAFGLAPRLNSAGRLGDAGLAVRLLLSDDPATVQALAAECESLNRQRRALTDAMVEAALGEIGAGGPGPCIVLYRPEWHEGILGIVAGHLVERFGVPVLLLARRQAQAGLVGSGRAPQGFPLLQALTACSEHLLRFGGHATAAGFSLREERVAALRAAMLEQARLHPTAPGSAEQAADLALPLDDVSRELHEALQRAGPFGEANAAPVLYSEGAQLLSVRPVGAGGKHLRLVLRGAREAHAAVWWRAGERRLAPGPVSLYYRTSINRWQGEARLQLVVQELSPAVAKAISTGPLIGWSAVDRRDAAPAELAAEFARACHFAEGTEPPPGSHDRYGLAPAATLVLLTPPAGPRLFEELLAATGAREVVLAWPRQAPVSEGRFLPLLLALLGRRYAAAGAETVRVSLAELAVATGELEPAVEAGLQALAASELLAIDESDDGNLLLRRRREGAGVAESEPLRRMRTLLSESRAFRRYLRQAEARAIRTLFTRAG